MLAHRDSRAWGAGVGRFPAVKSSLLTALAKEPNKGAQHKIVHVIAMTASKCAFAKSEAAAGPARFVLGEAWPALMDAFQTLVRSPTAEQRLLGLFLAQTLLSILGDGLAAAWAGPLLPLLRSLLTSPPDADAAIAAARTAVTIIRVFHSDTHGATAAAAMAAAASGSPMRSPASPHPASPAAAVAAAPGSPAAAAAGSPRSPAYGTPGRGSPAAAGSPGAGPSPSKMSPQVQALQQQLLVPLLSVVRTALGSGTTEGDARHVIQDFVELVRFKSTFVRPVLPELMGMLTTVLRTDALEDATRVAALELAVTLCEFAGGMLRKHSAVVDALVAEVCERVTEVDDDATWGSRPTHKTSFSHDEDDDENPVVGFSGQVLDRLSSALGGVQMVPRVLGVIGSWFEHAEWRRRRAACLIIGLVGEGSKKALSPRIDDIARGVARRFADPHPRVRFAALVGMAQLITDFEAPEKGFKSFQTVTHSWLVPAIVGCCSASTAASGAEAEACGGVAACLDKMRQLALHTLQLFFHADHCKPSFVRPLEPIMRELFAVLAEGSVPARTECFLALASLSTVIGDDFAAFYDTFMPRARAVVAEASASADAATGDLRNTALECIGVMCSVVPQEKCRADAIAVMESIKGSINPEAFGDDTSGAYRAVGLACAHLARALGSDFAPYLGAVLPSLVNTMAQNVDIRVDALDADEIDKYHDSRGAGGPRVVDAGTGHSAGVVNVPGQGHQRVTVNSEALQQKTTACSVVYHILQHVGEGATLGIDHVAAAAGSCATQSGSETCRIMGGTLIPLVVHIASLDKEDPHHGSKLLAGGLGILLDAWNRESSDLVMNTAAEAINELFKLSARSEGRVLVSPSQLAEVMELLGGQLSNCAGRWGDTREAYHE